MKDGGRTYIAGSVELGSFPARNSRCSRGIAAFVVLASTITVGTIPGSSMANAHRPADQTASVQGGGGPQITDRIGDANLSEDLVPDSRPASLDHADIVSVEMATEFLPRQISLEETSWQPIALLVRFALVAPPRASGPAVHYRLRLQTQGCRSSIQSVLPGTASVGRVGVSWTRYDASCPGGVGTSHGPWTMGIDPRASQLWWWIPFSSLNPEELSVLGPGTTLADPRAETTVEASVLDVGGTTFGRVDRTAPGREYRVASDVPGGFHETFEFGLARWAGDQDLPPGRDWTFSVSGEEAFDGDVSARFDFEGSGGNGSAWVTRSIPVQVGERYAVTLTSHALTPNCKLDCSADLLMYVGSSPPGGEESFELSGGSAASRQRIQPWGWVPYHLRWQTEALDATRLYLAVGVATRSPGAATHYVDDVRLTLTTR